MSEDRPGYGVWKEKWLLRYELTLGGNVKAIIAETEQGHWDAVICRPESVLGEIVGCYRTLDAAKFWVERKL